MRIEIDIKYKGRPVYCYNEYEDPALMEIICTESQEFIQSSFSKDEFFEIYELAKEAQMEWNKNHPRLTIFDVFDNLEPFASNYKPK